MADTKNKTVTRQPYISDMKPVKNFNKIEGEILHIKTSSINNVKLKISNVREMENHTVFQLEDSLTDSPYHDLIMVRVDWEAERIEYRLYNRKDGKRLIELPSDIRREDVEREKIFLAKILSDLVGTDLLERYFADREVPF